MKSCDCVANLLTLNCGLCLVLINYGCKLSQKKKMALMNPGSKITHACVCTHTWYVSTGLKGAGQLAPCAQCCVDEGVFPQQQWQGWVQRDYCECFMADLITPSWLLCEILTPKENTKRWDSFKNLLIVHPVQIIPKY